MDRDFVERRDGSFYLIGSRVPLAYLVREFQQGEPPEAIRSHYPTLNLEQVYGAITFYLVTRAKWKLTSRSASTRRMHTARRIRRPPTSKRSSSVCGSKCWRDEADE